MDPDNILFVSILVISYYYLRNVLSLNRSLNIKVVLYVMLSIGLLQLIYSILQLIGILPNLFPFKFGGSFGNPGDLANFLVVTFSISLGLLFHEDKKIIRGILLASIVLHLLIIIVSHARAAWLASIVSTILIFYIRFPQYSIRNIIRVNKNKLLRFVIVLICAFLLGVFALYKLYNLKSASADGRIFIWNICVKLITEKPVFGHGYNSFLSSFGQSQLDYFKHNPDDFKNGWLAANTVFAFNDYLQIMVEYGCIALMLLFVILYKVLAINDENKSGQKISLVFICKIAIISILLSMLFSYPLQNRTIKFCFFVLLALVSVFDDKSIMQFNLKKGHLLIAKIVLFMYMGYIFYYSLQSVNYGLKWKQAYSNSLAGTENYVSQYDSIHNFLIHDFSFVLNYGSILYKSGHYDRCTKHFEKYGYLCLSTDMYLILGRAYEETENYMKAEESYRNASQLIPHQFLPKYNLFKLYKKTNQIDKANDMALQISYMKIKVYSEVVKEIKTEINQYLLDQNVQAKSK